MDSSIVIRKLSDDDVTQFRDLRIEAATDSPKSFYPDAEELRELPLSDFRQQVLSTEYQVVFGAFKDGQLIGIVGLRRDPRKKIKHKALIWALYTTATHRGNGVARKLVEAVLHTARALGDVTMLCLDVHSTNIAAKALYESVGFAICGKRQNSMLVDGEYVHECYMELNLCGSSS